MQSQKDVWPENPFWELNRLLNIMLYINLTVFKSSERYHLKIIQGTIIKVNYTGTIWKLYKDGEVLIRYYSGINVLNIVHYYQANIMRWYH